MIDEYKEALDELRFSPEAKRRMAQRIEAVAAAEPLPRPTRRSRALVIAAAAAVLALAVGCTAYLAGAFVSLEDFAEDLFGGAPSQTEVIDKIGRPIGASAVSNGVAITADAVIGDNEHCVAVFSIARTDGMPIEGVDTIFGYPGGAIIPVYDALYDYRYDFGQVVYDGLHWCTAVQSGRHQSRPGILLLRRRSFRQLRAMHREDDFVHRRRLVHRQDHARRTRRFGDGRNDGRRQNHSRPSRRSSKDLGT